MDANHSWMSDSNYGGVDKYAEPKDHINYGEAGQNMEGDFGVPDEVLATNVIQSLEEEAAVDTTDITLEVDHGVVTLTGTVPQRDMLGAAEECVRNVPGVISIINDLRIDIDNF